MTDREKLRKLIHTAIAEWEQGEVDEKIADHLLANGVTFVTDNNVGNTPVVPGHDDQYNIAEMSYNNGYAKGCEDSKQKWIPVSERLPDWRDRKVLVFTKYGFSICERTVNGRWKGQHANWITHWMPLPEPPKEDGYE